MNEKIASVSHGLKFMSTSLLLERLVAHQQSFAYWRLPNTEQSHLLIDLHKNRSQSRSIEELDKCFVINKYQDSHPPNPITLHGDLIITISEKETHLEFSPSLSSKQLEDFDQLIQTAGPGSMKTSDNTSSHELDFVEKVQKTIDFIRQGNASKVVISRFEDFKLNEGFSLNDCFEDLKESYPNAFCYLTHTPELGTWMGASPERLISIDNNRTFKTESLAGTQYLPDVENLGEVAWTQKEIEEQAMVSRYIIDCLKKIRLREFKESGPKTVKAGKLVHLKTEYLVDMVETNMPDLGSIMLSLLHPTSAVCGSPREAADSFLRKIEGYNRSLYAGFLGPVNFKDTTAIFVNLRCMQLFKNTARLYAGAGITEDSNPEKEYQETINKMKTLQDIL